MEAYAIRLRIREKLKDGRLPYDNMPRSWGGSSAGKECDACDTVIKNDQRVMGGIASTLSDTESIQFHVACFQLWDHERRMAPS